MEKLEKKLQELFKERYGKTAKVIQINHTKKGYKENIYCVKIKYKDSKTPKQAEHKVSTLYHNRKEMIDAIDEEPTEEFEKELEELSDFGNFMAEGYK